MKKFVKRFIPPFVLACKRHVSAKVTAIRLSQETREKVFTDIYKFNVWGGSCGEFCSGDGSRDAQIIEAYICMVKKLMNESNISNATFVDLGCGDFYVGRHLVPFCSKYVGVDIVKHLIDQNKKIYESEVIRFYALDIVAHELPDGDVCFLRQVLQHLSNDEINAILDKLKKFKFVLVTEHYPSDNNKIIPNKDKVHGAGVRVSNNSGVYLAEPPFSIPEKMLQLVLEVPGTRLGKDDSQSFIRTYLYKPQN